MFLSISESKIAELLRSSEPGYAVFTSDLPVVSENFTPTYPTTSETSGAVYSAPLLVTAETKEHLMSARRKIEESGVPLKSADEIAKEIGDMRRRR